MACFLLLSYVFSQLLSVHVYESLVYLAILIMRTRRYSMGVQAWNVGSRFLVGACIDFHRVGNASVRSRGTTKHRLECSGFVCSGQVAQLSFSK
jgi:hypothetical protein